MNIEVTRDNVTILEKSETPHENEYKITTCYFIFDEFTSDFQVKRAIFTVLSTGEMYETDITHDKCDIPSEVLTHEYETVKLGVYGFNIETVDNEEVLSKRFSPSYAEFVVPTGSYEEGALSPEIITPTQYDLYSQALQEGLQEVDDKLDEIVETVDDKLEEVDDKLEVVDTTVNNKMTEVDNKLDEVDDKITEVDGKITEVDTAITETNNLNLDVSDKIDGDITVTLTKKDASTKSVVISDGTSLQFRWQGTSLGIKTDDMSEYIFVDLQGVQGVPGPQGEPFRIKKTYSSVAEMNADFDNMEYGDYVMIASTVEVEDNAKLYTRGESQWIFITDFSGATGIKGETGATPNIQIGTVTSGSTPSVTRTGSDENPVLNFVLQPGPQGQTGQTGATGNGIASITKTSTSGLVDTYTITFTSGNTTTFNVTNGNGIDHISLTSQSGATKVYTIYYTNGTTTDFTVQDGEVTQEVFDKEVERAKMVYNALPKVSDEGTDLTLNNTAECPVYDIELSPSELSQDEEPSPDNPQDIHTISGDNEIIIESNLFSTEWEQGEIRANGVEASANSVIRTKGYIPVIPNQHYAINRNITGGYIQVRCYDKNKNFLGSGSNYTTLIEGSSVSNPMSANDTQCVIAPKEDVYYLRFNDFSNNLSTKYMMTRGDTQYSYQPYIKQTYPLSLGDLEYCKIGTYEDVFFKNVVGSEYYDSTLEENKWYLKKNAIKQTFNGTEEWKRQSSSHVNILNLYSALSSIGKINNCYCNIAKYDYRAGQTNDTIYNICKLNTVHTNILIDVSLQEFSSILDFTDFLTTNNMILYYTLDNPTDILLNDTLQTQLDNIQKAISYQDQTNVSQENNDLPFVIKMSAIRDMSGIFDLITG